MCTAINGEVAPLAWLLKWALSSCRRGAQLDARLARACPFVGRATRGRARARALAGRCGAQIDLRSARARPVSGHCAAARARARARAWRLAYHRQCTERRAALDTAVAPRRWLMGPPLSMRPPRARLSAGRTIRGGAPARGGLRKIAPRKCRHVGSATGAKIWRWPVVASAYHAVCARPPIGGACFARPRASARSGGGSVLSELEKVAMAARALKWAARGGHGISKCPRSPDASICSRSVHRAGAPAWLQGGQSQC